MMQRLGRLLKGIHEDTSGKMSVEMILLIGLIALPLILILVLFKGTIIKYFNGQATQIVDPGQAQAP
jgi:Flp pilus assembly pilin Flp